MLKQFCLAVSLTLAIFSCYISQAHATVASAVGVRLNFGSTAVTTVDWQPMVSSTAKAIKGIMIYSSNKSPIEVGMATASSSAGSEIRQFIVPGVIQGQSAIPQFYPMVASQSMRISIRALNSAASLSGGEMDMSLFYN